MVRSPDHPNAFTRARKLPLPTLLSALLSFRGASVQSALDDFFSRLDTRWASALVFDRALVKLLVPALWAPNDRLIAAKGGLHLFKGHRLVCADGTLLATAQRALYLPGNDLVAAGHVLEGERQMLFDQLNRLRQGDVLLLDHGYPASWQVQVLIQRGIDFIVCCDSTQGWGAARSFLCSGHDECWSWLSSSNVQQVCTRAFDGPACMRRACLVHHVNSSGHMRVLVTSLVEDVTSVAELTDLYHGRCASKRRSNASNTGWGWSVSAG